VFTRMELSRLTIYLHRFGTSSPRNFSASYHLCFGITQTKQGFWFKGGFDLNVFGIATTEQRILMYRKKNIIRMLNFFPKHVLTLTVKFEQLHKSRIMALNSLPNRLCDISDQFN
jgi:hypothetical protein